MIEALKTLVFVAASICLTTSCSTMHEATRSQRTPIEQLLISEAVLRSLPAAADGKSTYSFLIERDT